MEKEFKIKRDVELNRKCLYDCIKAYANEGYIFTNKSDYDWFIKNVAQPNEIVSILDYEYDEYEDEFVYKIIIHFVYVVDNSLQMSCFCLTKQNKNFKLAEFQKGE